MIPGVLGEAGRPLVRTLLVAALAGLAACSGGPTSQAVPGGSPPAPAASTATPTAPSGGASPSPPAPAGNGGAVPAGFQACPPGGVTSGEPPAADNGPRGACEAARILLPPAGPPCRPAGGSYAGSASCPLYPALAQRLDQHPLSGGGGGADPVCRCQNTWQAASYAVRSPLPDDPTGSDVRVTLDFGAGSHLSFDVIVEGVQSGSLVSDIQCGGGGPGTSILQAPSAANRYLACG
jgi:hypothetical protein